MKINKVIASLYFVFLTTGVFCPVFAQQKINDGRLIWLLNRQDTLRQRLPIEKAYLQTDKSLYAIGDTIWFKGYVFNADYLKNTSRSGLLYVELVNDSTDVAATLMVPLKYGLGYGQIAIDGKDVPEGSYTLKAYTNWMRNFGEDYIFSKNIYVTGANNKPWLTKVKTASAVIDGKQNITAAIAFSTADKMAVILREMRVKVQEGDRTLLSGKTQTDVAGMLNINFTIPPKANVNNLNLHIDDLRKGEGNRQMNIPLIVNRPENTDLQFMPEGGNMIAGLLCKVGFKAIGEDGRGVNISGKIYDGKQQEIVKFSSLHNGMGSFVFIPLPGEVYTARVDLPDGIIKTYPLPIVKNEGTSLYISNIASTDSVLSVMVSTNLNAPPNTYYLIGQSRGVVCYVRILQFDKGNNLLFSVNKNLFPTGIVRFSLINRLEQPVNERMVYIDHGPGLTIRLTTDKPTYSARDSVALQIKVTDNAGKPLIGSFSLAVTDDEQVPVDSLGANMINDLFLTSDLKGTVEEPGYYLQQGTLNKAALDNLLLTQGWVGYDWPQVTGSPEPLKFAAEREFTIKGNVTGLFSKQIAQSKVLLMSKRSGAMVTQTDAKGKFEFTDLPVVDSALYFVQGTNKHGKSFGIGVMVDQTPPPVFSQPAIRYIPWFVNTDTAVQKSVRKAINQRIDEEKLMGDHVLKDVQIRDKKVIKGSFNLNGPGGADQVLDEHLMDKSGDMTLEELLEKNVKGFRFSYAKGRSDVVYMVGPSIVNIYIDGIDTKTRGRYNDTKYYLDNFTAKDIKGIELMTSVKYRMAYDDFIIEKEIGCRGCPPPPMFIEVTTRANVGPYYKQNAATYVYRPAPFSIPKQFYRPKYILKTPGQVKDLRSTIYWAPNIITDKEGKAIVTFYASDRPNSYTITIEGSDMNGNIGGMVKKLTGGTPNLSSF